MVSSSESDPAPATGSSLPTSEGGSEMQAIVIPASPEPGLVDQAKPAGVARTESQETDPASSTLQVIHPSDEGRPGKSKFMRSELPRPLFLERIITNFYAPSREPKPPKVEITPPEADEVKFILLR